MEHFGMYLGLLGLVGGLGTAYCSIWFAFRARQLRHQERMAMIEKGLVPPEYADSDGLGKGHGWGDGRSRKSSGVFMICMGIAISLMFYQTSGPRNTWIGAFVILFGLANLIGAMLDGPRRPPRSTNGALQPRNPE